MAVYYNEFDPYPAQWLRNLIAAGLLPAGDVDERSIVDVQPDDLREYDQCHFFAGIGGWPLALRMARWEDDRPVWTGSCPCQPLSSAGKRKGHADERHLWPAFHDLISECRPPVVLGEQVASKDGREWLAGVRADMEALGYACGASDLCAAGVGAPHIRQRLWWVADAAGDGWGEEHQNRGGRQAGNRPEGGAARLGASGAHCRLADSDGTRERRRPGEETGPTREGESQVGQQDRERVRSVDCRDCDDYGMAYAQRGGQPRQGQLERPECAAPPTYRQASGSISTGAGHWEDGGYIVCADGKARLVEPSIPLLVDGVSNRVGRLRAYGNAIVPQVAAEFIRAFMGCRP